MKDVVRAMVVPFLMALFPALWFVNRNVTTDAQPPHLEPTPALLGGAVVLALAGSAGFAALFAVVVRKTADTPETSRLQRVLQPNDRALQVLACLLVALAGWAVVALLGIGPAWLEALFWPLVVPIGLPLLVLAPLAIHSWTPLVVALVCCALWMAVLSNAVAAVIDSHVASG